MVVLLRYRNLLQPLCLRPPTATRLRSPESVSLPPTGLRYKFGNGVLSGIQTQWFALPPSVSSSTPPPAVISIMEVCVSREDYGSRPPKTPKLDEKLSVESKPISTYERLRGWEPETDEYVRQRLRFHCQFEETKGFGIEWEKYDYFFNQCDPYDGAPPISGVKGRSNDDIIRTVTLRAIDKYNQDNGKNLVFVEHIDANFTFSGYMEHRLTFWARDMSSACPESKIYQVHTLERSGDLQIPIFRVKPTPEEMMAAPVRVKTPLPMRHDIDKPPVVFRRARPGEEPVPGTPFVFSRDGVEEFLSDSEDEEE